MFTCFLVSLYKVSPKSNLLFPVRKWRAPHIVAGGAQGEGANRHRGQRTIPTIDRVSEALSMVEIVGIRLETTGRCDYRCIFGLAWSNESKRRRRSLHPTIGGAYGGEVKGGQLDMEGSALQNLHPIFFPALWRHRPLAENRSSPRSGTTWWAPVLFLISFLCFPINKLVTACFCPYVRICIFQFFS